MKTLTNKMWIALGVVGLLVVGGTALAGKINSSGEETQVVKVRSDGGYAEMSGTSSGALNVAVTSAVAATGTAAIHESGYTPFSNGCQQVLCSTVGDGGTLTTTVGARYQTSVVDPNGSPVQVAMGMQCGAFGPSGRGQMMPAGRVSEGPQYQPDGGVGATTVLTCCAQTATSTAPAGPYLQVCPE